jgi:hypothetical protein
VPAEAREGQLEQKRCYRPDKPDGVLRTLRFVSVVAANCGPAGIKPAETSPLHYTLAFSFKTTSPCFECLHAKNTDDNDFTKRLLGVSDEGTVHHESDDIPVEVARADRFSDDVYGNDL